MNIYTVIQKRINELCGSQKIPLFRGNDKSARIAIFGFAQGPLPIISCTALDRLSKSINFKRVRSPGVDIAAFD